MPELPEVECLARAVREETRDHEFVAVRFLRPDLREPMPFGVIRDALVGQVPCDVRRRSKYLIVETGRGSAILHLGMSGQLLSMDAPDPVKPHTHVIFEMRRKDSSPSAQNDGGKDSSPSAQNDGDFRHPEPKAKGPLFQRKFLHFVDPRRFGRLTAVPASENIAEHPWLRDLGPEPLEISADALADHLFKLSRSRKTAVKPFIMDGGIVVGVGNIYASESLFLAGIRPGRAAGRVTRAEYGVLARSIQKVLNAAIKSGGTTFRDYLHSDGSEGSYALRLNVYGRSGEACRKCRTPIREMRHSNRSTYFCGTCQK
jgi:formamidopyrimidine-DNA glycosylase